MARPASGPKESATHARKSKAPNKLTSVLGAAQITRRLPDALRHALQGEMILLIDEIGNASRVSRSLGISNQQVINVSRDAKAGRRVLGAILQFRQISKEELLSKHAALRAEKKETRGIRHLGRPLRLAMRAEVRALVGELGSRATVGQALGLSLRRINRLLQHADAGNRTLRALLNYLHIDEVALLRKHEAAIAQERVTEPRSRRRLGAPSVLVRAQALLRADPTLTHEHRRLLLRAVDDLLLSDDTAEATFDESLHAFESLQKLLLSILESRIGRSEPPRINSWVASPVQVLALAVRRHPWSSKLTSQQLERAARAATVLLLDVEEEPLVTAQDCARVLSELERLILGKSA